MKNGDSMWMVTHGSYSDYGIDCVCRTEAQALKIAAEYNMGDDDTYDAHSVEEVPFYTSAKPTIEVFCQVVVTDEGEVRGDREWRRAYWPHDDRTTENCEWDWRHYVADNTGTLTARGTDLERVRKVFSEQRTMFIAEPARRLWATLDSHGAAVMMDLEEHAQRIANRKAPTAFMPTWGRIVTASTGSAIGFIGVASQPPGPSGTSTGEPNAGT